MTPKEMHWTEQAEGPRGRFIHSTCGLCSSGDTHTPGEGEATEGADHTPLGSPVSALSLFSLFSSLLFS